jgi:hypothetical protein
VIVNSELGNACLPGSPLTAGQSEPSSGG